MDESDTRFTDLCKGDRRASEKVDLREIGMGWKNAGRVKRDISKEFDFCRSKHILVWET
jgi:hypothetical protein